MEKNRSVHVLSEILKYKEYQKLKILDHSKMYDWIAKFIQQVVLIKDIELTISNRTSIKNFVSKLPFASLRITDIYRLPDLKIYDVNKQKISLTQPGKITVAQRSILFSR